MPEIVSIGPHIDQLSGDIAGVAVPRATLDVPRPIGIVAESAAGFGGRPGIAGSRLDGSGWAPRFELIESVVHTERRATFELLDSIALLGLTISIELESALTISLTLANQGDTDYTLQRLAASVPLPPHATDLLTFGGRWCQEFQTERTTLNTTTLIENRTGRTSHRQLPAVFAGTASFSEQHGEVWGVQLAWSGNYTVVAESLPDGRRHIQAGELLEPGELVLAPGERYVAPDVVVGWSASGLSDASDAFHRHVRGRLAASSPRPVILNTWEAVYFDHRFDTLAALADVAAEVGVERFVLDDGWFGGRRNDTAGLGDWWVSEAVWPGGLGPIVEHVTSLGMQFGLWVEPEMVNPDSELYRTHPDWTLTTEGYEPLLGRNQLVLDLGRPDAREFIYNSLAALLDDYDIAYLKWDMNREIVQGSRHGRAGVHGHVQGVYEVMDRLRSRQPGLEIESCASGGGRADLGILDHTDRIWTSDCNDALERQLIQRGCSMLFPPEVMGAHVGPERAHTTYRRQDLGFRAATALFGHLGIEWNLLEAAPEQRAQVASLVALYKRLRPLLHAGRTIRVDHADPSALVHGVVSRDARHALFAYVQLTPTTATNPAPLRLAGLDPNVTYRVHTVEDLDATKEFGMTRPQWLDDGIDVSGSQLCERGLALPVQHPESILLVELVAVGAVAS